MNYHTAEELETTLATNTSTTDVSTPDGLNRRPGLATALAWDNYDENTETLSGAGTLHDTFGICYQNTMPEIPTEPDPDTSEPEIPVSTGEKRKRSFSMSQWHIVVDIPQPLFVIFSWFLLQHLVLLVGGKYFSCNQ